jgi:hypothetical protein
MSKPSYAEQISNAQVMVAGLRANAVQVNRRGIDEVFTTKLDADRLAAGTLNDQQEKLKADLKSKTAELDAKMNEMEKELSEAKKIVKMDFSQDQWKQFGIEDKR